jgi:hypothetical protein
MTNDLAEFLDVDDNEPIWLTADGEEIPYSCLSDVHLKNIIRMLSQQISEAYLGYWPDSDSEAYYYFEQGINRAEAELEALEILATERELKV